MSYTISKIYPDDACATQQIESLLRQEGIRRDANLDYTCGMFDEDMELVATGSCFGNTLRCLAVNHAHQGEGLMNGIMTHLMEVQFTRGHIQLFLYTKCNSMRFFQDLGFYEIARVDENVVFMENDRHGFHDYLQELHKQTREGVRAAAVVMNANPFTLGHLYLVEKAAAENDILHLFMVSEDASLIPFTVRRRLIEQGTEHLNNICYHVSGPYIISNATFPSYFQKDDAAVIEGHARLDIEIFTKIAQTLHIQRRYVGEEPASQVTGIYNQIMQQELPKAGIDCIVVPRKAKDGRPISASTVRELLKEGAVDSLRGLVPETTRQYFLCEEAKPVLQKIAAAQDVVHY